MLYVFKTNKSNYLIVDFNASLDKLPFEEEELQYVCKLPIYVDKIVEPPDLTWDDDRGLSCSLAYITLEQLRKVIDQELCEMGSEIDTKPPPPGLHDYIKYLKGLESRLK